MANSASSQIKIMLIFCISGIIIGTIFDIFRIQRKIIKTNDIVTYIQDILFWIISSIVLIITVIRYTDGEIRSYMILGVIVGVCVYFFIISKYIMGIFKLIKKIVIRK